MDFYKRSVLIFFASLLLLTYFDSTHGARILGIFPSTAFSHQLPFQAIMKALASRGHEITVITCHPLKTPVENYTTVDLSETVAYWRTMVNHNAMHGLDPLSTMKIHHDIYYKVVDFELDLPQLKNFMKSSGKFDLVVFEKLFFPAYFGLIHHVGSPPVISISSFGGKSTAYTAIGNPHHPAYTPDVFSENSDYMSFRERIYNVYAYIKYHYMWYYDVLPRHEGLLRKYFGSAPPPLYESEFNESLLIVNNHWSLSYVKPLLPNVVEVTGLHVKTTTEPLPKNLKDFLDGAKHGVVYFSLGTMVRSEMMREENLQSFLEAFSEIPQRVLWKWEKDPLPELPSNVRQEKWIPQQDVLAHPNIRVFITQGGLQSFQEAAYHGVPLIGMPFFGDQQYNVGKFVSAKIGARLEFNDLTKETLLEALDKVINDTSYRANMKTLSAVYREAMADSLDRAIWWIEYVLRHNGAHHLRSAAQDLTWYQYLLLDVIAVLILGITTTLILTVIVIKKLISFSKQYFFASKLKKS